MNYRKLVKLGTNSLVISLPPEWIKKYNLEKGDTLYVEAVGDYLLVQASEDKVEEQKVMYIRVEPETQERSLRQKLMNAYYDNATTIVFEGKGLRKNAQTIVELTELFTALEVVEHTSSKIICKTYINTNEVDVESFVRRIDNTIRSLFQDLITLNEGKELEEITKSIIQRHKTGIKLVHMLKRVIKDRLYKQQLGQESPLTLLSFWDLISILEDLIWHIKRSRKEKHEKEITKQLLTEYESNMKAFYKKELREAEIPEQHQTFRLIKQDIQSIGRISY